VQNPGPTLSLKHKSAQNIMRGRLARAISKNTPWQNHSDLNMLTVNPEMNEFDYQVIITIGRIGICLNKKELEITI
jgi:hypothetical protein